MTDRGRQINRNGGGRLTTASDRLNTGNHLLTETERTEPENNREISLIEAEQYFRIQFQGFIYFNSFVFLFASTLFALHTLGIRLTFALPFPFIYKLGLIVQTYLELRRLSPVSGMRMRKIIDLVEYITILCCLVIYSIVCFTPKYLYYIYAPIPYFIFIMYFFYKSEIDETLTSYARCGVRIYLLLQSAIVALKWDSIIDWNWKTVLFLSWVMIFLLLFYSIGLCLISFCTCYYLATGEAQGQQVLGSLFLLTISTFSTVFVYFFTIGIMDCMENASSTYLEVSAILAISYAALIGTCSLIRKNELQLFLWRLLTEEDDEDESETTTRPQTTDTLRGRRRRRKKTKKAIEKLLPGNKFLVRFSSTYFKMATSKVSSGKGEEAAPAKKAKVSVPKLDLVIREEARQETGLSPPSTKRLSKRAASTAHPLPDSPHAAENRSGASPNMKRLLNQSVQMDNHIILDDEQVNKILSNFASPRIDLALNQEKCEKSNANCLICFDQLSNAVFMDCGHGGICYDCGLEIWKKSDECYLCREKIKQLVKVDVKALEGNQVKILAAVSYTHLTLPTIYSV
eukprot:TRINITY_DN7894_c0_g1_i4.p1 TRINITY_DN7894_c0_g1~~TRINITY_DN7894_c0_g1_i4.p1  ORF type:complete len:572 (+),score=96.38 TRINITY_DN7894_c0_g1_i4:122-1837(+)